MEILELKVLTWITQSYMTSQYWRLDFNPYLPWVVYSGWAGTNGKISQESLSTVLCMQEDTLHNDWKRSVFIPIPKKGNAKECANYHTIALISHARKVMRKFPQARLQQFMNQEYADVKDGFRKGRGSRDQIANIHWIIIEKAREFQKNIYFWFIDYAKAFDCVDHSTLWRILKRVEYQTTLPASWEICI